MNITSLNAYTSAESTNSSIDFNFNEQAELDHFLSGEQTSTTTKNQMPNQTDDIKLLIDLYDPQIMPSEQSILSYWEMAKEEHPQLYKLATVVFAIPPTEIQIERDFFKLNYVLNDRRCSLTQERIEDLMLLNLNQELLYAVKEDELREIEHELAKKT